MVYPDVPATPTPAKEKTDATREDPVDDKPVVDEVGTEGGDTPTGAVDKESAGEHYAN